jgi:hypothetical protein
MGFEVGMLGRSIFSIFFLVLFCFRSKKNQKTPPLCIFWLKSGGCPHIGKLLEVFSEYINLKYAVYNFSSNRPLSLPPHRPDFFTPKSARRNKIIKA